MGFFPFFPTVTWPLVMLANTLITRASLPILSNLDVSSPVDLHPEPRFYLPEASVHYNLLLSSIVSPKDKSPTSSTSSLSSALDEELTRPQPTRRRVYPLLCDNLLPPLPGWVRIPQSCQTSDLFEVINFHWKLRPGIRIASLLHGTRKINYCDNLLESPGGLALMRISWEGYPSAHYCIAVKGRLLNFTVKTLGQSIADNIQHYVTANNIELSLDKIFLVAFGRSSCNSDWVAIIDRFP